MLKITNDTICAISTPSGVGGISVIRISGPDALIHAGRIFSPRDPARSLEERPQLLRYGTLNDPVSGDRVDEALVAYMRGPNSYTGEDVVEINCHGGPVVMEQVLKILYALGARQAESGEFTKRAYLNGRIDLVQAESVLDVIHARSTLSLEAANRQLSGELSRRLAEIRSEVLDIWAELEAAVDFSDEDLEATPYDLMLARAWRVHGDITRLMESYETGKVLSDGLSVVIIGRPNAGKSSLLNWLLKEEKAIVTDIPGTTRDVIEDHMLIRGVPIRIQDTAGIIDTDDLVEKAGIERALERAHSADIIFLVLDVSEPMISEIPSPLANILHDKPVLIVLNKSDLNSATEASEVEEFARSMGLERTEMCRTSASLGKGLDDLERAFLKLTPPVSSSITGDVIVTKARHKIALSEMGSQLEELIAGLEADLPEEVLSVNAKECLNRLDEITGETVHADVLDRIFSKFCIGK